MYRAPEPAPTVDESAARILVVDDHDEIRQALAAYLRHEGLDVRCVVDGPAMEHWLAQHDCDLVVLDVMLPGENGLSLCRRLRAQCDTPVILLTAVTGAGERVTGFEHGADDYVEKPFDPRELLARIRSVLRRHRAPAVQAAVARRRPAPPVAMPRYCFDGWCLDSRSRELRDPQGAEVRLSPSEFQILREMLRQPRQVLSRDHLLNVTRSGPDGQVFDRSIDTQVSRLRKKIERDPRKPQLLKTAWGDGYVLAADVTVLP